MQLRTFEFLFSSPFYSTIANGRVEGDTVSFTLEIIMGTEKLLDKLTNLLNAKRRKQIKQHNILEKTLKKLKKR
ncbi:MAG: hypothetical protein D3925_12370, partial [Candidatus Electrothrix sp. AR5]|nr:hypothetical protein [Candidatus Electrothrix sp. AR5]